MKENKSKQLSEIITIDEEGGELFYKSDILESIDEILSLIMEYYIILLLISDKRNTIIHTGLAHSSKIVDFLKDKFGYTVIESAGLDKIEHYQGFDGTNACLYFDDRNHPHFAVFKNIESKKKKSIL